MARWRLTHKHNLNVIGNKYEYKETSNTGRSVRRSNDCALFLDPEDPGDCNYVDESGMKILIVAHDNAAANSKDILFRGPPTPDMVPLDDEAKAISAELEPTWGKAFTMSDDVEGGYTQKLLLNLTEVLQANKAGAVPVNDEALGELKSKIASLETNMASLMEMNRALIERLPVARRA